MKTECKNRKMRPAYIENILLWMIMFIGFVTLFFTILDYASVLRIKDNMQGLSDYGARMVSLDKSTSTIVDGLNELKVNGISTIASGNLVCTTDAAQDNYQVIFITQTTYTNTVFTEGGVNNLVAKTVVFNETSSDERTCTLTVVVN